MPMTVDKDDTNIAEMSGHSPEGPAIKDGDDTRISLAESAEGPAIKDGNGTRISTAQKVRETFLAESGEGPMPIEVTVFKKTGGPLTKKIALRDGAIVNDSAACFMAKGTAHRVKVDSVQALAALINSFGPSQAYALGCLKDGVPDGATVVVADAIKDEGGLSVIARTKDLSCFQEGRARPRAFGRRLQSHVGGSQAAHERVWWVVGRAV
jgi:hypothetical protein